jgi:hypothetical protein|tara:strand:- start:19 stop:546 length:528 start_codon:yes stop_codon:yes gene_type:complete
MTTVSSTVADEIKVSDAVVFTHKEYNVTNTIESCCACFTLKTMLYLEPDEVALKATNCCGTVKKRLPYGELGSVDVTSACGCCKVFNAGGLAPSGQDGQPGAISPGCGCSADLVTEIVEELNKRQRLRGDVAQMRRADEQAKNIRVLGQRMNQIDAKMDAILAHLKIPQPAVMVR